MQVSSSVRKFLAATTLATGSLVSSGCGVPNLPPIEDGTVLKSPAEEQLTKGLDRKLDKLNDNLDIVLGAIALLAGLTVVCSSDTDQKFKSRLDEIEQRLEEIKKK